MWFCKTVLVSLCISFRIVSGRNSHGQKIRIRPAIFGKFDALSVVSEASASNTGKTKLTVTGHTLGAGESYVYKTHATAAPTAELGDDLSDGWTSWNGSDELTATTGHKITVAVKDANSECVAAGSTDVTSKAAG